MAGREEKWKLVIAFREFTGINHVNFGHVLEVN